MDRMPYECVELIRARLHVLDRVCFDAALCRRDGITHRDRQLLLAHVAIRNSPHLRRAVHETHARAARQAKRRSQANPGDDDLWSFTTLASPPSALTTMLLRPHRLEDGSDVTVDALREACGLPPQPAAPTQADSKLEHEASTCDLRTALHGLPRTEGAVLSPHSKQTRLVQQLLCGPAARSLEVGQWAVERGAPAQFRGLWCGYDGALPPECAAAFRAAVRRVGAKLLFRAINFENEDLVAHMLDAGTRDYDLDVDGMVQYITHGLGQGLLTTWRPRVRGIILAHLPLTPRQARKVRRSMLRDLDVVGYVKYRARLLEAGTDSDVEGSGTTDEEDA